MSRVDPRSTTRRNLWLLSCLLLALAVALSQLAAGPPTQQAAADPVAGLILLSDPAITESSGLAVSHRAPECFWTHNDSGHTTSLFAFNRQGLASGGCTLAGVAAIDLEDCASYVQDGVARLLVADVGDNRSARPWVRLYCFDEPDPHAHSEVTSWSRLELSYPDGPRDCEAVMVDADAGKVTLVSKTFWPRAAIYQADLPARQATGHSTQTLRRVGQLPLPLVTAMDRDPSTGDILLVNYFQLFRFPTARPHRRWWEQTPQATDLPKLKQIEAVAADQSGAVWVSSEGNPAPLARVAEPASSAPASGAVQK